MEDDYTKTPLYKRIKEDQEFGDHVGEMLIAVGIILLVGWFFLSSARPAWSKSFHGQIVQEMTMGNAVSMDIQLTSVWEIGDIPVPYQYWNTSDVLTPWYVMYLYQLTLELYEIEENIVKKQAELAEKIERNKRIEEWKKDRKNYLLLGAFGALIVTLFGTVFYFDKRRRRVKL